MPERPSFLGRRGAVVLALGLLAAAAWVALDLGPGGLVPRAGGARIARDFLAAALRPAFSDEGPTLVAESVPFLVRLLDALRRTLVFAAASMALALPVGAALGLLASRALWAGPADEPLAGRSVWRRLGPAVRGTTRVAIALLRSVHELLWAVLLLAAFGISTAAAVVALAIPFAGVLAKVFSELIDEAPREAAVGLRAVGAGSAAVFLVGTLPRALPDMAAYAFYRFECAVRSSAILGFFGYPTLGYHLKLAFENLHYREVWSYLYALLALVLLLEAWGAALRRRFVA